MPKRELDTTDLQRKRPKIAAASNSQVRNRSASYELLVENPHTATSNETRVLACSFESSTEGIRPITDVKRHPMASKEC